MVRYSPASSPPHPDPTRARLTICARCPSPDHLQPVEPSLTATNDSEDSQTPALVVTTDASTGDSGEGEHLEPRDVTPSHPLPSTILSPVASPLPQSDLTAEPSPDSPDYALVAALKAQLRAVEERRDQINTKLVRSLERCADLEDEVFHAQDGDRQKAAKIVTLEEERKEHLHALECVSRRSDSSLRCAVG
jgi:hypothetical protein